MTEAYPLHWPHAWPRTPLNKQQSRYRFQGITPERATRSLLDQLRRLGTSHVVISSNVPVRQDGTPRADAQRYRMDDPGVALYFQYKGRPMVMAQDQFDVPYANIRSLALAIEAMRAIERHGGGHMMERSFEGFAQLPPAAGAGGYQKRPWRDVLDMPAATYAALPAAQQLVLAESAYRNLAKVQHPDAGGDAAAMAELNIAITDAREELR